MGHSRIAAHPRIVAQQTDDSCWAAALESWLGAVKDTAREKSQSDLLKSFAGNDKSFNVEGFRNYAGSLGMNTVWLDIDDFPDHIAELLAKSVLFVSYHCESTSPWFHDIVLYGLGTDDLGVNTYLVMNPSARWTKSRKKMVPAGYQTWERGFFFPVALDDEVLVGWKEKAGPGRLY
jgi:hypothetical protein